MFCFKNKQYKKDMNQLSNLIKNKEYSNEYIIKFIKDNHKSLKKNPSIIYWFQAILHLRIDLLDSLNFVDINSVDEEHKTALHYAVLIQNEKAVKKLLEMNIDFHLKDVIKKCAIHYAMNFPLKNNSDAKQSTRLNITNMLYEAHKRTNTLNLIFDAFETSILSYSIIFNYTHLALDLIKLYPNLLNYSDRYGKPPLFHAIENTNEPVIQALIKHKVKKDLTDVNNLNAIFYAIDNKELSSFILKKIIDYGFNLEYKGKVNTSINQINQYIYITPLVYAICNNNIKFYDLIKHRLSSKSLSILIVKSTEFKNLIMVKYFISTKKKRTISDYDVLKYGIKKDLINLVNLILKDINITDLEASIKFCKHLNNEIILKILTTKENEYKNKTINK